MNLYQPTITGSLSVSGSVNISGSITIAGGGTISGTASIATTALTASFVENAQTASYVLNAVSSSFALTASSADNLLVRNTLTAQTLVVQTITSSVDFVTGSTRFGSTGSNTHVFTGSVSITGSLSVNGTSSIVGTGTTNTLPKFTAASTIGNSNITDSGTLITLGSATNVDNSLGINASPSAGPITSITLTDGGSGYADGTYTNISFTQSGQSLYGKVTYVVSGGIVTSATLTWGGSNYYVGQTLTTANTNLGGTGSGLVITVATVDSSQFRIHSTSSSDISLFKYNIISTANESLGSIKWEGNDSSAGTSGLQAKIGAYSVGTSAGGYLSFFTRAAGSYASLVEAMRIDSTGNVGIGKTPSTGVKLDVSGSTLMTGSLNVSGSITTIGTITAQTLVVQTITSSVLYSSGSNVFGNLLANTQTFTGSVSITGSALNVNNGGLFVSSSNNVGINTTNPTSPLTVKAGSRGDTLRLTISGSSSVSDAVGITFGSSTYDKAQIIAYNENTGNAAGYLTFWTGGTPATTDITERMRITSAGFVGIGTNPITLFHAYNASGTAELRLERSGSGDVGMRWKKNNTDLGYISNADWIIAGASTTDFGVTAVNNLILGTASTERLKISNTGVLTHNASGVSTIVLGASANYTNISSGGYGATLYMNGATRGGTGGATSGCVVLATDAFFSVTDSSTNNSKFTVTSAGCVLINNTLTDIATLIINGFNTLNGTVILRNPSKGANDSHIHYSTYGDWYIRPSNNSGSVYVKNYVAESDARLKDNIENISYGLDEILSLTPRKFNWKEGNNKEVNGFIAQEVEKIIPNLVSEGQWKSVDYQGITAILVKAIQEQQAQIEAQQQQINTLLNK